MGTVFGVVIGVFATILVARYYFIRTTNKKLSVFVTLNNRVFAGIESQVRQKLEFRYNHEDINELQQIDFIVANEGDKAIRDCIEPLTIHIAKSTRLLDASILHREPSDLRAELSHGLTEEDQPFLTCAFPLLNSGEFFYVKLLLDQYVKQSDLTCRILCDDLPRNFRTKQLPLSATRQPKRRIEWAGVGFGAFLLAMVSAFCVVIWSLYQVDPSIFPYPWSTFQPSWTETTALAISVIGAIFLLIVSLVLMIGMGFEEFFDRHPRFPLPQELRGRSYRFLSKESLIEADVPDHETDDNTVSDSSIGATGHEKSH